MHGAKAASHFGKDKTIAMIEDCLYWPTLNRDVSKIISKCQTYQMSKWKKKNTGL